MIPNPLIRTFRTRKSTRPSNRTWEQRTTKKVINDCRSSNDVDECDNQLLNYHHADDHRDQFVAPVEVSSNVAEPTTMLSAQMNARSVEEEATNYLTGSNRWYRASN